MAARKVVALNAARSRPGWYDRGLMTVRRLAATTGSRRRRLLNTRTDKLSEIALAAACGAGRDLATLCGGALD
jgi:hypothetical protein